MAVAAVVVPVLLVLLELPLMVVLVVMDLQTYMHMVQQVHKPMPVVVEVEPMMLPVLLHLVELVVVELVPVVLRIPLQHELVMEPKD
jgi:hypothetical protein